MAPRIARLKSTTFCGQRFTRKQIARILDVVETFPLLSRSELALTVCEQLRLQTPSGNNRLRTALNTLAELQDLGLLTLPPPRKQGGRGPQKPIKPSSRTAPQPAVEGPLAALGPVRLALADGGGQVREWNAWVDRYHPLGYRQPIGAHLRYFVLDGQGRKLGCLPFDFAVRKVACRDEWIGWAGAEVPQASQAGGAECSLLAVSLDRREKPGFARAGPGGAAGRRRLAAAAPLPAGPAGNLCRQRAPRGNLLPGGGLAVRRQDAGPQGAGPQPGRDAQGGVRAAAAPALAAGPAARAAGPRPQEVGRARRRRRRARPSARQRRSASCRCGRACWPTWCA